MRRKRSSHRAGPSDEEILNLADRFDEDELARRLNSAEREALEVLRQSGREEIARRLYVNPRTVQTVFLGMIWRHSRTGPDDEAVEGRQSRSTDPGRR